MHITIKKLIFLAILGMTFSSAVQAQANSIDVVGIRLGMSAEEVRAALKAHDPGMKISNEGMWQARPGIPASLANIVGCKGFPSNATACKDRIVVYFGQSTKKAFYIDRKLSFVGEDVFQQTVAEGVIKKYGKPTVPNYKSSNLYFWAYDERDNPLSNVNQGCSPSESPPMQSHGGCGVSLRATVGSPSIKLSSIFVIQLFDHRLLRENIDRTIAVERELNQNRENNAKNAKVKL